MANPLDEVIFCFVSIDLRIRLEEFLSRHASSLHPNHFLFTSVRQSLSQLYGRDERYLLNTLTMEQLERKVSICQQLLSVADVVEPGLTRLRGLSHFLKIVFFLNFDSVFNRFN